MKSFIFAMLMLLSTNLFAIDKCFTGSWYDPFKSGEGLTLEVTPYGNVVYFYTFDVTGDQEWFVFQGEGDLLTAYDVTLENADPFFTELHDVGVATVEAVDNNTLIFTYSFVLDLNVLSEENPTPWCLHDKCEGELVYTRLTQPVPCN